MILIVLLIVGCKKDETEPELKLKRVVLVYIVAENSLSPFAPFDLNEMREGVKDIPDSCQLVVYYDIADYTQNPQLIAFDKKEGERMILGLKSDPISTDGNAMQQVLSSVKAKCPAKSYGLVMWSHGSGWIPEQPRQTIGIDNGRNDRTSSQRNIGHEMEISTLAEVLQKSGMKWDYVFFDACFMQCVEVAYELRNMVDWCIGSPAEIPGDGAPYAEIMADLFRDSDESWRIAEDYYKYYLYDSGVVLSAIKTSELEQLAEATAPLLTSLPEYPTTQDLQRYNPANTDWKPAYYDMGSAMGKWCSEADYQIWRQALEQAIPHRFATNHWLSVMPGYPVYPEIIDREHIAATSMYIPVEGHAMNDYYAQTAWWKRMRN